jgi:hypothetical protein
MEYRSYIGRDFCEHWVERSAVKLTVRQSFAQSSSKSTRGFYAVARIEGCLKFVRSFFRGCSVIAKTTISGRRG